MPRRRDVNEIRDRLCDILYEAAPSDLSLTDIWIKLMGEFSRLTKGKLKDYLERNTQRYPIRDYIERVAPGFYRFKS